MDQFVRTLRAHAKQRDGVLANQHLQLALDDEVIVADDEVPAANIQPASLDLRLGGEALRLRCSFLPNKDTVLGRANALVEGEPIDLSGTGAILNKGRPYLIRLKERLNLPKEIRARANPKSSTGRADVFTRVITDRGYTFDDIVAGYSGDLFLEVVPLSFDVRVCEGLTLNQLRLSLGRSRLDDEALIERHKRTPLLFRGGGVINDKQFTVSNGLFLSLNLKGDKQKLVGYMAKHAAPHLDLTRIGASDVEPYWERQNNDGGEDRIILQPRRFYLLMSDESVSIPSDLAAEMTAYDPTSGELRTHYAGFFDPGFGYGRRGELNGSTAALEVRAHDVDFLIEHRQRVCKLTFEEMLDEPDRVYGEAIGSNYQGQTSTLGKHFRSSPTTVKKAQPAVSEMDQLELAVAGEESRPASN